MMRYISLLLMFLIAGCTRTVYQPVESVHTEYRDRVQQLQLTDSITDTQLVYIQGDTVINWRDRIRWRDRVKIDSVLVEIHDTVPKPYPVEKELTRWQQTKMDFGGFAMALCVAMPIGLMIVIWIRRTKR